MNLPVKKIKHAISLSSCALLSVSCSNAGVGHGKFCQKNTTIRNGKHRQCKLRRTILSQNCSSSKIIIIIIIVLVNDNYSKTTVL